jgi:hypothetical protein
MYFYEQEKKFFENIKKELTLCTKYTMCISKNYQLTLNDCLCLSLKF